MKMKLRVLIVVYLLACTPVLAQHEGHVAGTTPVAAPPQTVIVPVTKVIPDRQLTGVEQAFLASVPDTDDCAGLRNACEQMLKSGIIHIPPGGRYIAGWAADYWRSYQVWTADLRVTVPTGQAGPVGPPGPTGTPGAPGQPGATPSLDALAVALAELKVALQPRTVSYLPQTAPGALAPAEHPPRYVVQSTPWWQYVLPSAILAYGGYHAAGAIQPSEIMVSSSATGGAGGLGGTGGAGYGYGYGAAASSSSSTSTAPGAAAGTSGTSGSSSGAP